MKLTTVVEEVFSSTVVLGDANKSIEFIRVGLFLEKREKSVIDNLTLFRFAGELFACEDIF